MMVANVTTARISSMNSKWVFLSLIILSVCVLSFVVMLNILVDKTLNAYSADEEFSLSEVEAFIGIELPSDASDIHNITHAGIDRILWLKFKTSEGNALQFVRQTVLSGIPQVEANKPILFNSINVDWWDFTPESPYLRIEESNWERNRYYKIALVETENNHVIVYLQVHNN